MGAKRIQQLAVHVMNLGAARPLVQVIDVLGAEENIAAPLGEFSSQLG